MLKNIAAVLGLVVVAVGGALIIQKGGQNLSQLPGSSQVAQVATDGLLGYWALDDGSGSTAADGSSKGYSASVSGATWTTGKVGGGLKFTGSNSAKVSNKSSLSGMSNVTLSAWVRLDSTGTQYIVGKEHSGAPYTSYYLYTDSANHPNFTVNTSSGSANAYSNTVLNTGVWYHLTGVYDGSKVTIYVDGSSEGTANTSGNIISSDGPFSMNISFFKGTLDEVRVYSRSLSGSEVSTLANPTTTTPPPPTTPPPTRDTTAPVISNVSVSNIGMTNRGGNATIKWTTDEASDSYVQYGPSTSYSANTTLDTALVTNHSQVIVNGLAAETEYHFIVQSKDAAGNLATSPDMIFRTPKALEISDGTAPTTPSVSASVKSTSQINLTWTASTDPSTPGETNSGVAGYNIFKNGTKITTVTGTSYSDTGLAAGTTYSYTVSAYDGAGNTSPLSASVSATTVANPVTPPTIGKFDRGDTVKVTTKIQVRSSPSSLRGDNKVTTRDVNITGTVGRELSYYDNLLTYKTYTNPTQGDDGLIWWYINYDKTATVAAVSGWSTETYLTEIAAPPVQYTVNVVKTGTGTGTVTSSGSINCGATCSSVGNASSTVTLTATPSIDSTFTRWSGVSGCSTSATCSFTLIAPTTATAIFTKKDIITDNPPTAPTNLVATVISSTQINLSWTAAIDDNGVTGYRLYRNNVEIANITPATTTFNNVSLSPSTAYSYSVAAYDTANQLGPKSTVVNVTTPASPPQTYNITVTKTGSGVINSTPAGIDCAGGLICTLANVTGGTSVTLTATPSTGSVFVGWGGACSGTGTCTVSNTASITATFRAPSTKFTIGDAIKVVGTAPGFLNIRATPSTSGSVAGTAVDGAKGTISSGGTRYADSLNWWNVIINSISGWAAEDYLAKDTTTPPPPPAVPTVSLSASPRTITTAGSSVTLTWTTTNSPTSCTGTGFNAGSSLTGPVTVSPTQTTTYGITCTNSAGTSQASNVTVTVGTSGEYYPPTSRTVEWTPGVTVGVKGGIPNRTTIYQTLSPGVTSDQIVTALRNCPAGQVVKLNAGTYNLSSQIRILTEGSNCTLRGAGMGQTILKTSAWAALLNVGQFPWITEWPADTSMSAATKGATSITVGSTAGMAAGKLLYLEEDNITNEIFGFGSGSANSAGRMRDGQKVSAQIVKITNVSGTTVTFDPPLNFDFPASRNPRAVVFSKQGPQNLGIEDLTVAGSSGGYGVWLQGTANTWLKNVEITNWDTFGLEVQYSTNFEVRESYLHDPAVFNWSKGYSLQFDQTNNSLIENNTFYKFQDGILFQGTSAGNVVAYNTLYRSYPAYNGIDIMLASVFGNHTPFPTMNLYEGNYMPSFHSDYYYGPSSNVTLLRNYVPATDPDAKQNRIAMNIDSHQWNYNVIGNILGQVSSNPSITLALPNTTLSYAAGAINNWEYGVTDTNNFSYAANKIYRLGYPYIGNNSSSGTANPPSQTNLGAMDMSVKPGGANEAILHGNWDGSTKSVVYKSGETRTTIPSSYYTSKPSWWPTALAWPPYDAANYNSSATARDMLMKLPSGIRLVKGFVPKTGYNPTTETNP